MNIVIKYDPTAVLWLDDSGSGVELYGPSLESPIAHIKTVELQQMLELSEAKQYEDRSISPLQLAQNIAREIAAIAPLLPKNWPPAQIAVAQCFADALGLPAERIEVDDWIRRYSDVGVNPRLVATPLASDRSPMPR